MNFSELSLSRPLQEAIEKIGFLQLTPIQEQAIPVLLSGQDLAGLSQTGTGKTAAFLIPLIERILRGQETEDSELKRTRGFPDWKPFQTILVLEPTRELAEQSYDNFIKLTQGCGLKAAILFGGVSYDKQKEALAAHPQMIFATPGRLIDLYKENHVDFKQVRGVVFDEADRLFDMGFRDDMKFVLQRIPQDRQMILFSATLNLEVMNVAYQFGSLPVEINVSRDQATAENVTDSIFHVGHKEKPQHLLSLLKIYSENAKQVIIFTNYKNQVNQLSQFLVKNNYPAVGISSLLSQAQRLSVMNKFKSESEHNFLVATDVAARGLDIKGVDLVINYDLPQDPETYVHRIGRTGRAGRDGVAVSMVSDRDVDSLSRIQDLTKKKIDVGFIEDSQLIKEFAEMPYEREPAFRGSKGAKDLSPWNQRGPRRDGPNDRSRNSSARGAGPNAEKERDGQGDRSRDNRDNRSSNNSGDRDRYRDQNRDQNRDQDSRGRRGPHQSDRQGQGSSNRHPDQQGRPQNGALQNRAGQSRPHETKRGPSSPSDSSKYRHTRKNNSSTQRRVTGSRAVPARSQSVTQKVKSFFGRLFGKSN